MLKKDIYFKMTAATGLATVLILIPFISGARILLAPLSGPSHVLYFTIVGKDLIERGHSVDMILPEEFAVKKDFADSGISLIYWKKRVPEEFFKVMASDPQMGQRMLQTNFHTVEMNRHLGEALLGACVNPLSDGEFFQKLKSRKYDLAIMDGIIFCRCLFLLPYKLDVPFVTLTTQYEPFLYRVPALPSFVPFAMATSYTEKMTFFERLYNLIATIDAHAWPRFPTTDDSLIKTYAPEKPQISMTELARQSMLWFINSDPVLDSARPAMPHVVNVGGLTTGPQKKLPEEVATFLQDAQEGAILVSFGSVAELMPPEVNEKLLATFFKLKQKVIWKYGGKPLKNLPSHIMTMPWIPQNDILAHPNVKLFITHGGNNGEFEAMYNSVPMIVGPYFGEQKYNAYRVDYKGYGKAMSLMDFTPDSLAQMIDEIMYRDPNYAKKIKHASEIYKSAPETARQRLVYWVEHVLEFGADHLRSAAIDMPWYQYCMLDILAFLLIVACIFVSLVKKLLDCLCRICCARTDKLKRKRE